MEPPKIVSREEWLAARQSLLEREKAFTRERDALSAARRKLPWVRVDKAYRFEGPDGTTSLAELFGDKSQLVVSHFMFGPDWQEGCTSCSFWADGYDGFYKHLAQRDIAFVAISRAPLVRLLAYRARMGWSFPWVSSLGSDFNIDYAVSFPQEGGLEEPQYNYRPKVFSMEELPGVSIFAKDGEGVVYHSYSTYSRGLDMLNAAYHFMDLMPKGRDEDDLDFTMAWLRRKDSY